MDSRSQIQKWFEQRQWTKVIKAIEKQSSRKHSAELEYLLGNAYMFLGAEEQNQSKYKKALAHLLPLEKEYGKVQPWLFAVANCLYHLDRYGRAMDYCNRLSDLKPEGELKDHLDTVGTSCYADLAMPYYQDSFSERAQRIWKTFEKHEEQFRRALDSYPEGTKYRNLQIKCQNIFKDASDTMHCRIEKIGRKYQLLLGGEGSGGGDASPDTLILFEAQYLKDVAPPEIAKKWDIQIGTPPDFYTGLDFFVLLDPHAAKVGLINNEGDLFTVFGSLSEVPPPFEPNGTGKATALAFLISNVTGEAVFNKYLSLPWLDFGHDVKRFPLLQLPEELNTYGIDVSADTKTILEREVDYHTVVYPDENAHDLRADITAGTSKCMKFIKRYQYDATEEEMERLDSDGVTVGFFWYGIDNFKSADERTSFQESLIKTLQEKAGEAALTILGKAKGKICDYVDVILWDLPTVMRVALEFFKQSTVPFSGYHTFRVLARSLIFTGEELWRPYCKDSYFNRGFQLTMDDNGEFMYECLQYEDD
ncbi:MAG: hypothetical protein LUC43_02800 [Burkholderiales bacterium]|nr:hypothetical protein [Burkholderiales bacterium]